MKILDPGHHYEFDVLDDELKPGHVVQTRRPHIQFVKRIGEKFPGNLPPSVCGTTTQEVLRALIDRTKYVDAQIHFDDNDSVLKHLRMALVWLERRAALARGDRSAATEMWGHVDSIETLPTCAKCGHVMCSREEH